MTQETQTKTGKTNQAHSFVKTVEKIKEHIQRTAAERISEIDREFAIGFEFMKKYPKSITIYGSARTKEGSEYYEKARALAHRIVTELGYAVITGGGPGIMEAANRGAKEAGGNSIGFNIHLPHEQVINPYIMESPGFDFFFVRRVMLSFSAEAYVFFPGGFGTLDELFEMITLVQTQKIPQVPIILVGKDFWTPVVDTIRKTLLDEYQTISEEDTEIYKIVDDEAQIVEIVRGAPLRSE